MDHTLKVLRSLRLAKPTLGGKGLETEKGRARRTPAPRSGIRTVSQKKKQEPSTSKNHLFNLHWSNHGRVQFFEGAPFVDGSGARKVENPAVFRRPPLKTGAEATPKPRAVFRFRFFFRLPRGVVRSSGSEATQLKARLAT